MYHNKYRAAKKFKLQYDEGTYENEYRDGEYFVSDVFSGTAKRPLRRDWDDYRSDGFYEKYGNPNNRYIESRVGDKWDDIWSDICKNASNKTFIGQLHRKCVDWSVEKHVQIIDNEIYDSKGNYVTGLYIHPENGILCDNGPYQKRFVRKSNGVTIVENEWGNRITVVGIKVHDGKVFHLVRKEFRNFNQDIWMKATEIAKPTFNYWFGRNRCYYTYRSASKKDIKKYNLNNLEGD